MIDYVILKNLSSNYIHIYYAKVIDITINVMICSRKQWTQQLLNVLMFLI